MKRNTMIAVLLTSTILVAPEAIAQQAPVDAAKPAPAAPAEEATAPDIVVTGLRASLQTAAQAKRNAPEFVDTIVASDIGKLPDPNLADSLQRVPGVQLYRYAGEGLYPIVRGLVDQNRTEFNGRSYFSPGAPNGGGRDYQTDNALPELIAGIEVFKNPSSDHIEGAIGGLINVKTHKPFDFKGFQGTFSIKESYFDLADKSGPTVFGLVSNRWDTGIGEIGLLIAGGYQKTAMRQDSIGTNANNFVARPYLSYGRDLNGNGVVNSAATPAADVGDYVMAPNGFNQQQIYGGRERKGFDASLQWRPSSTLEFGVDGNYNDYTYTQNSYNVSANLASSSRAVSSLTTTPYSTAVTAADAAANPARTIGAAVAGYDLVNATYTGVQFGGLGDVSVDHPVNYQIAFDGKWNPNDRLEISGDVAYTNSKQQKTYRALSFQTDPAVGYTVTQDLTGAYQSVTVGNLAAMQNPANNFFNTYSKSYTELQLNEWAGRLDAKYTIEDFAVKALRVGGRVNRVQFSTDASGNGMGDYTIRSTNGGLVSVAGTGLYTQSFGDFLRGKTSAVTSYVSAPASILTDDSAIAAGLPTAYRTIGGARVNGIETGNPDFFSLNHFEVEEKTYAGYAMADFAIDAPLRVQGNVGVRVVRTDGSTLGLQADPAHAVVVGRAYDFAVANVQSYSYTDILPSLNMKANLTDELLVRIGLSKGVTRPPFSRLNPSLGGVAKTAYLPGSVPLVTLGNPDLKPQRSDNLDLSAEYYFGKSNFLYINGFYKKVKGFIINYAQYEDLGFTDTNGARIDVLVTRPTNAAGGKVKGIETGFTYFLDFLPGAFDGFGVQANYTFIDSTQQVAFGSSTAPILVDTQLANLSKHSYNLIGMYEHGGLSARLAWGWRGKYLRAQYGGGTPNLPLVTPAYGSLDASLSYDVTPRFSLTVEATNLTDSAPDRYAGGLLDRPVQQYSYDRRFAIGARIKIGD